MLFSLAVETWSFSVFLLHFHGALLNLVRVLYMTGWSMACHSSTYKHKFPVSVYKKSNMLKEGPCVCVCFVSPLAPIQETKRKREADDGLVNTQALVN